MPVDTRNVRLCFMNDLTSDELKLGISTAAVRIEGAPAGMPEAFHPTYKFPSCFPLTRVSQAYSLLSPPRLWNTRHPVTLLRTLPDYYVLPILNVSFTSQSEEQQAFE